MNEQTANDPDSWKSFFGPGIALRTRGFQLVIEDVSHWNVFMGVLATLIGVSSVGVLLAVILDHQTGLYLFSLCVASLIPIVVLLMAKRKVIVDLLRKKIKRITNRRLFWQDSKVIPVLDADRAEKKIVIGPTGKPMSKVILVLRSGEEFDVTMFADMMNDSFKDLIIEKLNYYLNVAHKSSHDHGAGEDGSDFEEEEHFEVRPRSAVEDEAEEEPQLQKGKERLDLALEGEEQQTGDGDEKQDENAEGTLILV